MTQNIIVDKEKCTGCGLCVQVCPYDVFFIANKVVTVQAADCFLCGHCRAVCPVAAVQLPELPDSFDLEKALVEGHVNREAALDSAALVRLMQARRSCRVYRDDPVPLQILRDLAKIGTLAPSATNSQGWNFIIVPDRKTLLSLGELVAGYYRRLNHLAQNRWLRNLLRIFGSKGLWHYHKRYYDSVEQALSAWEHDNVDKLFHGAAAAIIVTGSKDSSCPKDDALLATQNILLAAESIGLGSCLIGFAVEAIARSRRLRKSMLLPTREEVYSVICLGYPGVKYQSFPGRKPVEPRVMKTGSAE